VSTNSYNYKIKKVTTKIANFCFFVFSKLRLSKKIINSHANLDENLVYSLSASRIPSISQLSYLNRYLNRKEKLTLKLSLLMLLLAGMVLGVRFYLNHLELVPVSGGKFVEGVVGIPKYVNPLYSSINSVDMDLTTLVYSALYKRNAGGVLVNDLVESKEVSDDGKVYTFKIRNNVKFHNGAPLTTSDIFFTFNLIKDSQYRSPQRVLFSGVEAEVIDDYTIIFKLKEPFAGFPELLTFGILPQAMWGQLAPSALSLTELNLKPIGSGPYKFKSLIKDSSGNLKEYSLESSSEYFQKPPYIKTLNFKFYPSYEEAVPDLNTNVIDGLGFYPVQVSDGMNKNYIKYNYLSVPQEKGVYFNIKSAILTDKKIRQALTLAIDKSFIINKLFGAKVESVDSPILPDNQLYSSDYKKYAFSKEEAQKLIESAGWKLVEVTAADMQKAVQNKNSKEENLKKEADIFALLGTGKWYYKNGNYLIIKLSTVSVAENESVITEIRNMWEAVHVKTLTELVPISQIQSDIIKVRDYDALFSGEILSSDADPYPFWHSSQIGSEGLNLSNYSNKEVDKTLEAGRQATSTEKRKEIYKKFLQSFADDAPAILMYSPKYIYAVNNKVNGFSQSVVIALSDRFSEIQNWYIETGKRFKK